MVTAPTVVYVEWDPARVDLGPVVEGFGADLTSGPGFALFAVDGAAEARLMTSKLCQQPGRPEERPLLQIDALGLVDPDSRWAGSSVPAEPPCLTGEPVAEHPAATYSTRDADGAPLEVNVDGFGLDRFERPLHDWLLCAAAGECSPTPAGGSLDLPTTGVTAEQARAFCRRLGADLPTLDQWRIAALVRETGRLPEIDDFPWGREVSPDRANLNGSGMHEVGSHPSGTTWLGVEDLAGNAAEWVVVADRRYAAVGGSWRDSAGAGRASAPYRTDFSPAGDIGFRCAYPR
jgi:hypothetical protein